MIQRTATEASTVNEDTQSTSSLTNDVTLIRNRARALGERVSGSRTTYHAVTERDVAGKSPEEVLALLSPERIEASEHVREAVMLVDLTRTRPMTLVGKAGEPARVGTILLEAMRTDIKVRSMVLSNGLTVVAR